MVVVGECCGGPEGLPDRSFYGHVPTGLGRPLCWPEKAGFSSKWPWQPCHHPYSHCLWRAFPHHRLGMRPGALQHGGSGQTATWAQRGPPQPGVAGSLSLEAGQHEGGEGRHGRGCETLGLIPLPSFSPPPLQGDPGPPGSPGIPGTVGLQVSWGGPDRVMMWAGSPLESSRLWGMVPSSQGTDPKGLWPCPSGPELRLSASREATRATRGSWGRGSPGGLWPGPCISSSLPTGPSGAPRTARAAWAPRGPGESASTHLPTPTCLHMMGFGQDRQHRRLGATSRSPQWAQMGCVTWRGCL